ncbi:hypothetical protein FRB95_003766 [Tulasnella sp. JGI-2019a]|nr:hypothetical protein FRB95_003766 [Tulasnella sp. JGI-2019a]
MLYPLIRPLYLSTYLLPRFMNHHILTRREGQNTPIPVPVPNTVSHYHTLQPSGQYLHHHQYRVQYHTTLSAPGSASSGISWVPSYAIAPPAAQKEAPLAKDATVALFASNKGNTRLGAVAATTTTSAATYRISQHHQAPSPHELPWWHQPQPPSNLNEIKRPIPRRKNTKTTRVLVLMKSAMRNPLSGRKKCKKKVRFKLPEGHEVTFWMSSRSLFGIRPEKVPRIDKRMSKY